jgi:hypothetical protein
MYHPCAPGSRLPVRAATAAAVIAAVCLAALPTPARAGTNVYTSLSDFLNVTSGLQTVDFEGTAPPNDFWDYSDTGMTIGEATFNGKSINIEHLTYTLNGQPTVVDVGPDDIPDLTANDTGYFPDEVSVDGTSSILTAFNETETFNAANTGGGLMDYRDRFTLQTVFEIDLARPRAAFGFEYRGVDVFQSDVDQPLQQYTVQFFQGNSLIGDAGTITGIPDWTPDNPLFIGFTNGALFDRVVLTGINPPSPTDLGFFDANGSLSFDNFVFGQTAAPEPCAGVLAACGLLPLLVGLRSRRLRRCRFPRDTYEP